MNTLALNSTVQLQGDYPGGGGGGPSLSIGAIRTYGYFNGQDQNDEDTGGQFLNIASHTALFSLLGTTFGGNGITTFATPDLNDRVAVGQGSGAGLTNRTVGSEFGASEFDLTVGQLPVADGGSGSSLSLTQESTTVIHAINTLGIYPSSGGSGAAHGFMGQTASFAVANANDLPGGWVAMEGQVLSIASNTALFSLLGTMYGGDGRTTFGLPDARGRVIVGEGQGPGRSNYTLGEKGGAETLQLSTSQIPATFGGSNASIATEQPYLALNYLVALDGIFPSRSGLGSPNGDVPYIGEIVGFAGNFAPRGYAFADGQLLPISQNTALFSLYGTTFGGDGRTTFGLPDLRGRAIVDESATRAIGSVSGAESHFMLSSDLPGDAINDEFGVGDLANVGGNVFLNNRFGADVDPIRVTAVNNETANVGTQITLASGALVTVNSDGTFFYDANGAFEYLPFLEVAVDSFTYRLNGNDTATVSMVFSGADNDDTFIGTNATDTFDGGAGFNTISYVNATSAITFDFATPGDNTGDAENDVLTNFEGVIGTGFADTLLGDGDNNVLEGGLGDDTIDGRGGVDAASYAGASSGVTVSLFAAGSGPINTVAAGTDTLTNIENLIGSDFGDDFLGDNGNNELFGGLGDDTLRARFGDDTLRGEGGADTLVGRHGNNTLVGGEGDDIFHVGTGDTVQEALGEGNDRVNAYGNFTLDAGSDVELIYGMVNTGLSLTGNDLGLRIMGRNGMDTLRGGAGDDTLNGGAERDFIVGGDGRDMMIGGSGADVFVFTAVTDSDRLAPGRDFIRDFSGSAGDGDLLDLGAFTSSFIDTGAFTSTAGEVRYAQVNGNTHIYVDTDGNRTTDFMLTLTGTHTLTSSDFLFAD